MLPASFKPRILCVSIYDEMAQLVRHSAGQFGVEVDVFDGGIYNSGHLHALEVENRYDVIISQAGTAIAIQQMVKTPVVPIQITANDIVTPLREASERHQNLLCITYDSNLSVDIESLAAFARLKNFRQVIYRNEQDFNSIIARLPTLKDVAIVGFGGCVIEKAAQYGLPYYLIRSSKDSVHQAVLSARNIVDQHIKERTRSRRLNNIINYSLSGIVSVNRDKTIAICNRPAKQMLDLHGKKLVGMNIDAPSTPPELKQMLGNGEYTVDKVLPLKGKTLVVNRVPIRVREHDQGTIIVFQELSKIQKIEAEARVQLASKGLVAKYNFSDIIGSKNTLGPVVAEAKRYARSSASILIEGETGSGKELFAQSIHNFSERKKGPFVALNCAALPEHLLESELFGYEEGAFTGARKGGKPGMFELAHRGTLFLDEISEMSLATQVRLLRTLQEKEIFRIGGDRVINIDVRIIAASNRDLYAMAQEGSFRRDLFFRLNILPLQIPPLRKRKEDIPTLIAHFIKKNHQHVAGRSRLRFDDATLSALSAHGWPGNVRELEHILERVFTLYDEQQDFDALITDIMRRHCLRQGMAGPCHPLDDVLQVPRGTMAEMERFILEASLEEHGGNKKALADALGISRVTVWKKLKELEGEEQGQD
ncbi:sigma 54-interacting transcriptional regulator [Desulfovibrio desulfuricans]|uniref:sigma 54-interacting transcriptional regulator n=1 Tax=Desulfovibrio desulfuricans TaxID=876 RepID=UPI001D07F5C3|nr:sigma 54-interacting transcriptional regulator [Desulfovibrio desulfuricans]MCB6541168.1 sigma 54-interacting transcriptional regulator [Desulfovibrio desulfuricans]MCB6552250.1 sigma 54-interacting transcriptional regulator [Desulfovibrio desulfuricans]MCB6564093.1 sigma 54-interacting transcriptional regulator [Desulfovibrio desulfuricans]MCB7345273.1 sigma 54-interacting transcriptional regulator [Desulfovibrio desulfuricans]MCQ5217274.1 sigma 54-interacting transcriptional regulator [De